MAKSWQVAIGGKTVCVDSKLEERVLEWLEDNGFSNRWDKPDIGLHAGGKNYTPDVYLMIEYEGLSHRAIVEIKPVLHHYIFGFNDYIFKRMCKAARVFFADILLLYVEEDNTWYRINSKTGGLTNFGIPVPARITIDKAYKPLTIRAKSVYSHQYSERLDHAMARSTLSATTSVLQTAIQGLFGFTKPKRKTRRRTRKHW